MKYLYQLFDYHKMNNLPFKSCITELHYLPSVAFFSQIIDKEEVTIEIFENYQKGSYRNRCHIVGANGLMVLSIPLEKGKHQQTPIKEVKINYSENWHTRHWQSIKSAYGRAPFWEFYADDFYRIYQKKHLHLLDFNLELFNLCCKILKIKLLVNFSTKYQNENTATNEQDCRNLILPNRNFDMPRYPQLFEERHDFVPNLSILDLILTNGNQAKSFIKIR